MWFNYGITSNYRQISRLVFSEMSINKKALWINACVDDWTTERAIIASNVNKFVLCIWGKLHSVRVMLSWSMDVTFNHFVGLSNVEILLGFIWNLLCLLSGYTSLTIQKNLCISLVAWIYGRLKPWFMLVDTIRSAPRKSPLRTSQHL